jgi:hypothetical protein
MIYFELREGEPGGMEAKIQEQGTAEHPFILVETALRLIFKKKHAGLDLIREGAADVNCCGVLRIRPLGWASYSLWVHGVKELLELGADPRQAGLDVRNAACWALLGAAAQAEEKEGAAYVLNHTERRRHNRVNRGCVEVLNILLQRDVSLMADVSIDLPGSLVDDLHQTALDAGYGRIAHLVKRLEPTK